MKNLLLKGLVGVGSIGAVEIVPDMIPQDTSDLNSIVQIVVQLIIGVASLFGIFKKRKTGNTVSK